MPRWITPMGRRGAILLGLGIIWIGRAAAVLLAPDSPKYALLSSWTEPRAAAWAATGIVAIICAWLPQGRDRSGFLGLYLMPLYRFLAYLVGGLAGEPRGWVGALAWAGVMYLIVVIAGWPEPATRPLRDRRDEP